MKTSLSGLFDEIVNRPGESMKKDHNHTSEEHCQGCELERIHRETGSHISVAQASMMSMQNSIY